MKIQGSPQDRRVRGSLKRGPKPRTIWKVCPPSNQCTSPNLHRPESPLVHSGERMEEAWPTSSSARTPHRHAFAFCPFENFINAASHRLTLASEPFAPSCRFSKASFLFSRRCGAPPADTPSADHAAGPGHLGSLQPLANEGTCRSLCRHFILFLLSEYVLKFLGHMLRVFQPT